MSGRAGGRKGISAQEARAQPINNLNSNQCARWTVQSIYGHHLEITIVYKNDHLPHFNYSPHHIQTQLSVPVHSSFFLRLLFLRLLYLLNSRFCFFSSRNHNLFHLFSLLFSPFFHSRIPDSLFLPIMMFNFSFLSRFGCGQFTSTFSPPHASQ